jgi:hypothetical protein
MTLEQLLKTLQVIAANDPKKLGLPVYTGQLTPGDKIVHETAVVCDATDSGVVLRAPKNWGGRDLPERLTLLGRV